MNLADAITLLSVSLPCAAAVWKLIPTRDLLVRQKLNHIEQMLAALQNDVDGCRAEILGLYSRLN